MFILKVDKALCFEPLLEVLILKIVSGANFGPPPCFFISVDSKSDAGLCSFMAVTDHGSIQARREYSMEVKSLSITIWIKRRINDDARGGMAGTSPERGPQGSG